jgi:hypothetical protein
MVMHENRVEPELAHEPMGALLRRLSNETTLLVRQELELAKTEIVEKGKRAAAGIGLFAGSAALGLAALGAFTACLVLALSLAMAPWMAALLVTVVFVGAAAGLASWGKRYIKFASPLVPEQAMDSTKESVEWIKTRMNSGAR